MLSLLPPHRQYAVTLDGQPLATADTLQEAEAYVRFAFTGCVGHWRELRTLTIIDRHAVQPCP